MFPSVHLAVHWKTNKIWINSRRNKCIKGHTSRLPSWFAFPTVLMLWTVILNWVEKQTSQKKIYRYIKIILQTFNRNCHSFLNSDGKNTPEEPFRVKKTKTGFMTLSNICIYTCICKWGFFSFWRILFFLLFPYIHLHDNNASD